MSKIVKLLDTLIEYYDKFFRVLYNAWGEICRSQETMVITFLEFALLAFIYWIVVDKRTKNEGMKWVYRVLIGCFILYGIFHNAI